jgi:hypothetical protein
MVGPPELIPILAKLGAKLVAQPDDFAELSKLAGQARELRDDRDRAFDSLQPPLLGARRAEFGTQSLRGSGRLAKSPVVALPLLSRQLSLFQFVPRRVKLGLEFVDALVLAARCEEPVQPFLQRFLSQAQACQAGAGGEEQLAQTTLTRPNFLPGLREPFMVDPKKRLESLFVQVSQKSRQPLVGNHGRIIGSTEGISVTPTAEELDLFAVARSQFSAHPELVVGMDEMVDRQVRKAEQEVRQCP